MSATGLTGESAMNDAKKSLLRRLVDRVFPRMPNFYALINEQCEVAVESMQVFSSYMEGGDKKLARKVRELEHEGDRLKNRNIQILNASFSTPMDREDLYDAIAGIDHIINFAKTTVFELRIFKTESDECMQKLARQLLVGVEALRAGFALLDKDPAAAEQFAMEARKAERRMKKIYRRGLVELLDKEHFRKLHHKKSPDSEDIAMDFVLYVTKKREIYRHLSHAADRLARVSELLRDIVVKLV
jgi:uncharacterized protein Yka (UPF0111/DUF47 family)